MNKFHDSGVFDARVGLQLLDFMIHCDATPIFSSQRKKFELSLQNCFGVLSDLEECRQSEASVASVFGLDEKLNNFKVTFSLTDKDVSGFRRGRKR